MKKIIYIAIIIIICIIGLLGIIAFPTIWNESKGDKFADAYFPFCCFECWIILGAILLYKKHVHTK